MIIEKIVYANKNPVYYLKIKKRYYCRCQFFQYKYRLYKHFVFKLNKDRETKQYALYVNH